MRIARGENLRQAIRRVKKRLIGEGYRVGVLHKHRPFHLIAYEPNGEPHFVALCRLGDFKRKKQVIKSQPVEAKIDIFCY